MSTRTRIILVEPSGMIFLGGFAVKRMIFQVPARSFPLNWGVMPKRAKLLWLGEQLPPKSKLYLFQEPRKTRASKSVYGKKVLEFGVHLRKPKKRPEQPGNAHILAVAQNPPGANWVEQLYFGNAPAGGPVR
jgi:hypothetical protein